MKHFTISQVACNELNSTTYRSVVAHGTVSVRTLSTLYNIYSLPCVRVLYIQKYRLRKPRKLAELRRQHLQHTTFMVFAGYA
jgi:hypothetical protein